MSFVMVPTEIFEIELTSLQFRFLSNFIRISKINNGHSFFGYPNLAEINQCGRAAAIKTVQELEKMGFLKIIERGNKSRSNDILLTLDEGISRLTAGEQGEEQGYLKNTPNYSEEYLKDTPRESLNHTRESLNHTRGYDLNTPHKDKDLNKLYLNKNARGEEYQNITPRVGSKQLEPADVTAGRTMPNSGCAGSARKEGRAEGAQLDIEDYCLWQDFKLDFSGCYPWLQLVRVQNHLLIRGLGRMGEDILVKAWDEVKAWFAARGVVVEKVGQSQRFSGEIIIKEAV